jgi:hypothetical protein
MKIEFRPEPTIKLHGYSPETPKNILDKVSAGKMPSSLKGDFILVATGLDATTAKPLTIFVSTVVAAVPYFFYLTESHCVHADNVFDCCKLAELSWDWNWDALAQLALFDHVLDNASLHKAILRIPQSSIIRICGNKLESFTEPFWTELYESGLYNSQLRDAPDVILEILSELPPNDNYSLSLSSGYDSRVLLAAMAHLNRSTVTASMGASDSTDPRIALQLAHAVDFDFERIEITPKDYIAYVDDIVKTTSGEKLFWHWHTGIFSKKVNFNSSCIHLAGSNGEYARSYFFDKGFIANAVDLSRFSRWDYLLTFKNSVRRRVSPEILAAIKPGHSFRRKLDAEIQMSKVFFPGLHFGDGLDYFYASQRVRYFIGLGLALYRSSFPTMSPFLDARFIRYAAGLQRHDKLGDRMHRSVIGQLQRKLLDFPSNNSDVLMGSNPGQLYFIKHNPVKEYHCYQVAQSLPEVLDWARIGFIEIGGSQKELEMNIELQAKVQQWNLAITIGAVVHTLDRLKIKKSGSKNLMIDHP